MTTVKTNELNEHGYISHGAGHFRHAFAIAGALVGNGYLAVDFDDKRGWWNTFESLVLTIADTLDQVDD